LFGEWLKGDRNAHEEIRADSTGGAFAERMRSYVWRLRLDRTCASTAGLCASSYSAATGPERIDQDMTPADIAAALKGCASGNSAQLIALGDKEVRDFLVAAVLAIRGDLLKKRHKPMAQLGGVLAIVDRSLAALIIAMALSVAPAFSDDSSESAARSKLAMLVSSADELYDDAVLIVTKLPSTRNAVNRIHESIGRQWLIDERAFQESLAPLINADLTDDVADGIARLQQFDKFVLDAVGATYFCRNVEAVAGLKIANELLDHAEAASKGHPDPDWKPDLDSWPDDHGECE
jgi:hypothetical protein